MYIHIAYIYISRKIYINQYKTNVELQVPTGTDNSKYIYNINFYVL